MGVAGRTCEMGSWSTRGKFDVGFWTFRIIVDHIATLTKYFGVVTVNWAVATCHIKFVRWHVSRSPTTGTRNVEIWKVESEILSAGEVW